MATIPNIAHFVFGLRQQSETFHLLHYLAIESCRQVQQPEAIYFHYHHLPCGLYWDLIRPHLTLCKVDPIEAVHATHYDEATVPESYRYAHHADFIRLDALIETGGFYADIDTLFLRPIPSSLFDQDFVIGREYPTWRPESGRMQPGLCNALMLSAPGSTFAKRWREEMAGQLDGSWSNHSCDLALRLSESLPDSLHVEPEGSFMGVPATLEGLAWLLSQEGEAPDLSGAYSIHLWAHLWWDEKRKDFSTLSGDRITFDWLREAEAPLARMARPYLPEAIGDPLLL